MMICLFTDFATQDPYVGQVHQAIHQLAPEIPVIDLFHNLPVFNIRASAYLAAQYCPPLPGTVYCCIVDPGVGGPRAPVVIKIEHSLYVGPDNGIFEILIRRFEVSEMSRITWMPEQLSNSFHGRDLFAPVAARLAINQTVETSNYTLTRYRDWPDDAAEVLYIDHYGNAISGLRATHYGLNQVLGLGGREIRRARTFSEAPPDQPFWFENANGLVEIAVNQGSAARMLQLQIGSPITISGS